MKETAKLPVGILISFFSVALYKGHFFYISLGKHSLFSEVTQVIISDSSLISIFLFGLILVFLSISRLSIGIVRLLLWVISFWYALDTAAIVTLMDRMSWTKLLQFYDHVHLLGDFLSPSLATILLLQLIGPLISFTTSRRIIRPLFATAFISMIIYPVFHLQLDTRIDECGFGGLWNRIMTPRYASSTRPLKTHPIEKYKINISPPEGNPNIIFVVVESLSRKDSLKLSGLDNLLPKFDSLLSEGLTVQNYLSNGHDSEQAHIALFKGAPPLPVNRGNRFLYSWFDKGESIIDAYNQSGYYTEALSAPGFDFAGGQSFYDNLHFSFKQSNNDVPRFQNAKRFVFGYVPDGLVYEEALSRVGDLGSKDKPFFLSIFTASGHTPYLNPESSDNSPAAIWRYIDDKLFEFVKNLEQIGYFKTGIIIVVGDHRRQFLVTEKEKALFGPTARAQVPLLILGKDVPKDVTLNGFLDHAHLFTSLPQLLKSEVPRLERIYHIPNFSTAVNLFGDSMRGVILVLHPDLKSWDSLQADTRHLNWLLHRPDNFLEIETEVREIQERIAPTIFVEH